MANRSNRIKKLALNEIQEECDITETLRRQTHGIVNIQREDARSQLQTFTLMIMTGYDGLYITVCSV